MDTLLSSAQAYDTNQEPMLFIQELQIKLLEEKSVSLQNEKISYYFIINVCCSGRCLL